MSLTPARGRTKAMSEGVSGADERELAGLECVARGRVPRIAAAAASPKPPLSAAAAGLSLVTLPPSLAKKIGRSRNRVLTFIWDNLYTACCTNDSEGSRPSRR